MKLKNKLKLLVSSTISSFLLFSCGAKNLPVNNLLNTEVDFSNANNKDYNVQATTKNQTNSNNGFNFDLGVKNGASFSAVLNFNKSKGFSTKANKNGQQGHIKSDIQLLRVYLVNSSSGNLTASNIKYGPFDIVVSNGVTSLDTFFSGATGSGGSGVLNFNNVSDSTYYVAVAAYNSTTIIDSTTNINSKNTLPAGSSTNINNGTDLGRFALSTSGGDLPGLNGVVTVSSMVSAGRAFYGLANNGTASLGVTLNLADAIGADIDTKVTLVDGANVPTSPISVL